MTLPAGHAGIAAGAVVCRAECEDRGVAQLVKRVVAPFVRRSTYRRWAYLILGGALLVPYLLFGVVLVPAMLPNASPMGSTAVAVSALAMICALVVMAASSFIPAVRVLEGTAVRELLDDPIPGVTLGPARDWGTRWRVCALFMAHVLLGGVISTLSLLLPVVVFAGFTAPFTGRFSFGSAIPVPRGWAGAWLPAVLLLTLPALVYAVSGAGALLARMATALLAMSAAERIAELERRTEQLAERNRLARELHDSVGHALSVVTVQAGAARRVLRTDPEFAERALAAIEESGRAAVADLDHVLGLLREERADTAPQAGLEQLPNLLSSMRLAGLELDEQVHGALGEVPPAVSREAYRIVQECLTNVLRHAGKVPVTLHLAVRAEQLELDMSNPVDERSRPEPRSGGGQGLRGIRERVSVLGGTLHAGLDGAQWTVGVRLPWGRSVRA